MKKTILEIFEWTGSGLILLGYFLLVNNHLQSNDIEYLLLNIFASILLGISLFSKKAYGTTVLQLAFISISLWGIWGWYNFSLA